MAKDKLVTSILLLALLTLFFIAPEWQLVTTFGMWLCVVLYSLRNIQERLLLLLLQVTLFTFLMTRLMLPEIFTTSYISEDATGTIRTFAPDTIRFIYTTLSLSICSSFAGYAMIAQKSDEALTLYDTSTAYVEKIRLISKILSYGCAAFYSLLFVEKMLFVIQNGYFEMYAEFDSQMPGVVHKLASLYKPLLFLFLATFPDKREARIPLLFYFVVELLSLGTGSRTVFMLALLFLIFYLMLRNRISPDDPWLTRKHMLVILAGAPILLVGMFLIDFIRAGREMINGELFDMFVNFFYQQGTSAQVIGLSYEMNDILGNRIFSFGQIIDNFNKNFVFQLMGTAVEYRPQTEEMAMYGHSLSNTISYYQMYNSFLSGVGLGTSYIAEVWHDFGYIGLILWNMLYGIVLAYIPRWAEKGLWPCAFGLIMLTDILYAPRGHAGAFLNVFLSVTILFTFLFIHLLAKHSTKS
ncbi:MAG: O-antigen polysaccharide polymerase Wzy family protein [Paludibacteraceae bacterium]|nr:O-antigen polysaccharide polymerase Wzy family protein [Paludibacteraceae bacterium]